MKPVDGGIVVVGQAFSNRLCKQRLFAFADMGREYGVRVSILLHSAQSPVIRAVW